MSTVHQNRANRENAKLSTGPVTPEGKAKVSRNRLTHGLAARHSILPDEDPALYQQLLDSLLASFDPRTPFESMLVHQMAEQHWKLQRLGRQEAEFLAQHPNPFTEEDDKATKRLALLDRYTASAHRRLRQAYEDLRRSKADRGREAREVERSLDLLISGLAEAGNQTKPNGSTADGATASVQDAVSAAVARLAPLFDQLPVDARQALLDAVEPWRQGPDRPNPAQEEAPSTTT